MINNAALNRLGLPRGSMLVSTITILCITLIAGPAWGQGMERGDPVAASQGLEPTASVFRLNSIDTVHTIVTPPIDMAALAQDDLWRDANDFPFRFAVIQDVFVSPQAGGTWESIGNDQWVWRLRIQAPEAESIYLGFLRYQMPEGGQLFVTSADGERVVRAFTAADNEIHGQLWTPPVLTDDLMVEVTIPGDLRDQLDLELTTVGHGYRGFSKAGPEKSGSCNVDVVCAVGNPWQAEIKSVAVIGLLGSGIFCTGSVLNNTAQDETPYVLTANHCGFNVGNAASFQAFWNFETSTCGGIPNGTLTEFNTGSFFRAGSSASDFTLLELDDVPNPASGVSFAGWDRSLADPAAAICIHHPSVDEKRISFENDPTFTTSAFSNSSPGDGAFLRIVDWDLGTTEPGSSGSPLYNPSHQVVGQLFGGGAACGNNLSDWFGRLSRSWTGGGTSSTRLSDWLDPLGTGQTTLNTLGAVGQMSVDPVSPVVHIGDAGGPFTPAMVSYTMTNNTGASINYEVSLTNIVGVLINGGTTPVAGSLVNGASVMVTVSLDASVNALPVGTVSEIVVFKDLTNLTTINVAHDISIGLPMFFTTTDPPAPIPDSPGGPLDSTIVVASDFCISDVNADLTLTHTWKGDLTVDLIAPDGTTVRLHNRTGADADNILEIYDDDGGTLPDGPGVMADFENIQSGGTWTLRMQDHAAADIGAMITWSLGITQFSPGICAPPCPWDGDSSGDVGIDDFLGVLANWGPCPPPCPWDSGNNADVGIDDFLGILANWGACP